jgi:hypothetical protein
MAGTQNQPNEYEQVSYNSPDGAQYGRTSTELIAFWGATPVIRGTSTVANISTTAFLSTSGIYGFNTSTEGLQVTAALSTIIVQLKAVGLLT